MMMTIYLDSDYKCHLTNDGTRRAVKTSYFDGKCAAYIEGFCFLPSNESCQKEGYVLHGETAYAWRKKDLLDEFQAQYEAQLAAAAAAYAEGVNSI